MGINPFKANGLSHTYTLDDFISNLTVVEKYIPLLFKFI